MAFDTLTLDQLEIFGMQQDQASVVKKTTMDTLEMKESNNFDLAGLLAAFSPVFIKSYGRGTLATASFRGTGASHTQVLWNGFSINSPMLGQVDFSQIPNSFFNKVELYYGGGSLKETGGALGGSVMLEKKNEWTNKPAIDFAQAAGSFHSLSTTAGISIGSKKFGSDTRIAYRSSKNDFPYYNTAVVPSHEMTQTNANIANTGFTQQFNYRLNRYNELSLTTWNQWNYQDIPPVMTNVDKGGGQKEYLKNFFTRNAIEWNWHKNRNKLEVRGAYFYEDMKYKLQNKPNDDSTGVVTLIDSKNRSESFFGKARYSREFNHAFILVAGTDAVFNRINSNNYSGIKGRNTVSIYTDIVKDFKKRFRLNLLLRAEMADGQLLPVMPLFGVSYRLMKNEQFYLRASVSRNVHLPTLNDLYWSPGGNTKLIPEDAMETGAGLNYRKQFPGMTLSTDINVYASRINNWIQWVPSGFQYWSPQNIAEVFARGLEFSFRVQGKKGNFRYHFFAEYAFTKTTNESPAARGAGYEGRQLIYIPLNSANSFLFVEYKGFHAGWTVYVTGKRNTSLNNEVSDSNTLPAYMLNNVSAGKSWKLKKTRFELRFKVNNIFNVSYQAVLWRAMPGRNYELSFMFHLN